MTAEGAIPLVITSIPTPDDATHTILWKLAQDAAWLLSAQPSLEIAPNTLWSFYLQLLMKHGFVRHRGIVRLTELSAAVRIHYGSLLVSWNSELSDKSNSHWLARLVRASGVGPHPLHHLLLMEFLGYTAETFFELLVKQAPFGNGPWPCLNKASDHHGETRISECVISYIAGTQRPMGTFACDCGFIYNRSGPDLIPSDRLSLTLIQAYGKVWEDRLRAYCADPSLTLPEVARHLGVDRSTVETQVLGLGLSLPPDLLFKPSRPGPQPALEHKPRYRGTWLAAIEAHPGMSVRRLRNRYPGPYSWLYRHDREWLSEHRPVYCSTKALGVDWSARDSEVMLAVYAAADRLLVQEPIKSTGISTIKLTRSSLAREAGYFGLIQNQLSKLPRTAEALRILTEDRTQYALRRVRRVRDQLHDAGQTASRSDFIELSGTGNLCNIPEIAAAINQAIDSLHGGTPRIRSRNSKK